jgi:sirohydrochlorin cobaltochelatase
MRRALILLAHGARDPAWAQPFHHLVARVRALEPGTPARLAFLELMPPELEATADELVAEGIEAIRIVPIFLGQGGHVRRDLPQRLGALQRRHPGVAFACSPAAGEDRDVIDALARFCLREPESR